MPRVRIISGDYEGMTGDAHLLKDYSLFHVSIPNFKQPQIAEYFKYDQIKIISKHRTAEQSSILVSKELVTLHSQKEEIRLSGFKKSCSSVWCPDCFSRKGQSKNISERLSKLNYQAARQVVLTVDLKNFNHSGQAAYETLKKRGSIHQFIHDLKRTGKIKITDWVWILEWHTDGAPHWHLFIETQKGKKGQIGNKTLLRHWDYGLVFESYIHSKLHWQRFTTYFGRNGYFDPNSNCERKDKSHQLELPDWALSVDYKIRKTGSMPKKRQENNRGNKSKENPSKKETRPGKIKTYQEKLDACGNKTNCKIQNGDYSTEWKKLNMPYDAFKQYPGEYVEGSGYQMQMSLKAFELFMILNDFDLPTAEEYIKTDSSMLGE